MTNPYNDKVSSNALNMSSLGKALDTPVDERSGEWASSTLSALGPTGTTTSTSTSTASPLASSSPAEYPSTLTTHPTMPAHDLDSAPPPIPSKDFMTGTTFEPAPAPASVVPPSTSTFSPEIDLNGAPHVTNDSNIPGAGAASTATTPGLAIPGAYPGMEKERMTNGDIEMAKAATAVALERARELALATGETMMDVVDTVLPAVKAYMPSVEQTKEAAVSAGQTTVDAGSAAGQTVVATATNAGTYVAEAQPVDTTKSYLASASDVIRNYVPASVGAYLPGTTQPTTTLPSQELGQNEHPASSAGVGTLPGPPGEMGVAVLPDEHHIPSAETRATDKTTDKTTLPSDHAGLGLPGAKDEAGVAVLPIERGAGNEHVLMEKDVHSVLVGASEPGKLSVPAAGPASPSASNGSVAFVDPPFEPRTNVYDNSPPPSSSSSDSSAGTNHPNTTSLLSPTPISNTASTLNGASADASVRSLAGSKKEPMTSSSTPAPILTTTNNVPHSDPVRDGPHHQDSTIATPGHEGAFTSPATAALATTSPTTTSPTTTSPTTTTGPSLAATRSPGATSHAKSTSTSSSGSSGAGKKPSLFTKMKGEMKVLSGKIGHNEEKIEEGRRLMGKTASPTGLN